MKYKVTIKLIVDTSDYSDNLSTPKRVCKLVRDMVLNQADFVTLTIKCKDASLKVNGCDITPVYPPNI